MITIKDKKDSIIKMKELRLNYFPLDVFSTTDKKGIKDFFDQFPGEEFVLRSTEKAQGKVCFVQCYEEALSKLKEFGNEVTICVSYAPYKEELVLVGDICVRKKGGEEMVDITATTDSEGTNRNVYDNPEFNMHASLEEDRVWKIPGFSKIMRYIADHELFDVIVEFSVYDVKLGINKENVVISELRTSY